MLELNKIHCGDCLELMKEMPDNSVDCIITDPPYGINYLSNYYKDKNPHKPIENDDTLFLPFDELWRILKPTGCMFVFFSHKVPLINDKIKNVLIWVKNNWTAGDLYGDFGNQYECIAFIPKKEFKLKSKRYSNIWNFDRVPPHKLLHPTQKPIKLLQRIIKASSNQGDLILDPFMGSGTTAVACKQTDRRFIGIEISQEYVDIANKRLKQTNLNDIFNVTKSPK